MPLTFVGDFLPAGTGVPRLPGLAGGIVANAEFSLAVPGSTASPKAYAIVLDQADGNVLASSGLSAVCVANNHAQDGGEGSLDRVLEALRRAGVPFYGTTETPYVTLDIDGLSCAIVGALEPCRARGRRLFPTEGVASLVQDLARTHDRVFVTPHWGKEAEYDLFPSPGQRRLARRWIAAGAHAVLGHHTHTVQGAEWIGGRPLFYSLGNYWFDHEEGRQHPLTWIGLAVTWSADAWTARPFYRSGEELRWLEDDAARRWAAAHEALSAGLTWSPWRWARAVGPVYIPKSREAWRRRVARRPLRDGAARAAWSVLPGTLLLQAGALVGDRGAAEHREAVERIARGLRPIAPPGPGSHGAPPPPSRPR